MTTHPVRTVDDVARRTHRARATAANAGHANSKPARRASLVALVVALAVVASCFAERRGLSRDALLRALEETRAAPTLPTQDELLALRVPEIAAKPADLDALKPTTAVARAHLAAARGDIASAKAAWGTSAELQAHRCLVEGVLRDFDDVVDACGKFLDAAPNDPRAVIAVRVLVKAKSGLRAAGELVAKRGAAWVSACAAAKGKCADLAYAVSSERQEQARIDKDDAAYSAAVSASGKLRRAVVEGPFDGELRADLALDLKDGSARLRPFAPLFEKSSIVDEDGVIEPALRGADGLYRVRFAARGGGRANVYVTGTHAVRVRVDGVVVAERGADVPVPAITRAGVELKRGAHVVEVLAWSVGRGDDISVALLGDDGTAALEESGDAAAAGEGAGAVSVAALGAVESLPAPLEVADGTDVEAMTALLWRQVLGRSPSFGVDADENRQISAVLVGKFGWSPLALAVAAELVGDDRSVPDRVASSSAARLWAKVRESWPDHPVARIAEARSFREERPDDALAAYRALVSVQPRYAFGQRELIDLALEDGLVDEARASADALLQIDHAPENIDAAVPALRASGDLHRAAALDDERAAHDDSFAGTRAARRSLEAGRTSDGLAGLARAARAERGSAAIEEYVDLLALRDPKKALAFVDENLAQFPGDASLVLRRAQLLGFLQGDGAARTYLLGVVPRIRDSDNAARYLEELGVDPPWVARLALGDEIIAKRRATKTPPFPGAPAVALLDDVERDLYDDDSSLAIHHLIVELRSKEVLDRFGQISLGDARVLRIRVVKPDGSIIERERHKGVDDISLPQLGEDDIVEVLTVERDGANRMGGTFETRQLDGTSTPALSRRYILTFPEFYDERRVLTIVADNGLGQPPRESFVDNEGKKRTRLTFSVDNAPSATGEPASPDPAETAKTGGYAWGVDLSLWSRIRGVGVEQDAQRTAWLDACAHRIAGDGDDVEKLHRVFAFVARRIEPAQSPREASAALAAGQGARTPLLLALLRGAGLDADPVALQMPTQPDPATFDSGSWSSVAVRVRVGARDSFAIVDGNTVLDALPPSARGARVLELGATKMNAPAATVLPDDVLDDAGVHVQVDLGVDAKTDAHALSGIIVVTIPAAKADGARRGVRRATPEQLRVVIERAFSESFPGISVVDVKTPDLDNSGDPLRLGAHVTVPLPDASDGAARFDHLFAQGASGGLALTSPLAAYLAVADRKTPVLLGAEREVLELQLSLPKSAAFVEAPEPLNLVAGPFSLEQKVEIENGKLYWRREIKKATARISVEEWPAVRVALAGMAARSDARLSFVVGGTNPDTNGPGVKRASLEQTR